MAGTDTGHDTREQIAAIVLAAGASQRLGQPKQLVTLNGERLLCRVVRLALEAGCVPVAVVLGAEEEACRAALAGAFAAELAAGASGLDGSDGSGWPDGSHRPVWLVNNPQWREGMSTSLRAGLACFESAGESGGERSTLVLVSDQVRLTVDSLKALLQAHRETGAAVTAARYSGRLGVPAVFRPAFIPALVALTGDRGARQLLAEWSDRATAVDLPEAAFELDTPADLAALKLET